MDSETRATFRLTCTQAQHDVYAATSRLTWDPPEDSSVAMLGDFERACSQTLVAKCPELKGLVAENVPFLAVSMLVFPAGLQHLHLSCKVILTDDLLRISSASALQELHMPSCELQQLSPTVMTTLLQRLSCLRLLNLALCDLGLLEPGEGNERAQMLACALPCVSATLQHLDLRQNGFEDSAAETLAPALSFLVHLTTLKLGSNALGDKAIAVLSTSICTLTRLHHLDLDKNYYGNECMEDVACMVAPLRELRSINIYNIWYSYNSEGEGLPILAPVLASLTNMEEMKLTGVWAVYFVQEIVCMMLGQPNLTCVHLVTAGMGEEQAEALAHAILSLKRLKTLCLNHDSDASDPEAYATPGALHILVIAIAQLTALEHLSLAHNSLGREAAAALTELATSAMPQLQRLTHLNLNSNALGYEGAVILAPGLGSLHQLRELSLEDNEFRRAAVEVLAAGLRGLPNLRELKLGGNHARMHALRGIFLEVQHW